jgi:23S rRNA (cytidine1920-2'-O)/16S rRNA (cytidine1409-2'-O)-methyltransferase
LTRRRLDLELVRRGLATSRSEARDAILDGRVTVAGLPALKAGTLVDPGEDVGLVEPTRPYASRGGEKLAAALDRFAIDPSGRRCLDAGASTGGFTDVLLLRGAARVVAVDVGYGQLAWRLRSDPRVTVMDRVNVRHLRPEDLPYRPDLVAADLSFISLTAVLPALAGVAADHAILILLVKPQFESTRREVGRGVIRDPEVWARAIRRVAEASADVGIGPRAVMPSPLRGPAGNVEFLIHARTGSPGVALDVAAVVDEAQGVRA